DQLEKETGTVSEDFSFGLFSIATALSFTVTLATVEMQAGKLYELFWIITIIGYVAAIFFGIRWYRSRRNFSAMVKRIKERSGTLGEEGKEIGPEQLEDLSPAETNKP